MTVPIDPDAGKYLDAFHAGQQAYLNGHPKAYPGGPNTPVNVYTTWHEGWKDAWKTNTLGQITLGVYR